MPQPPGEAAHQSAILLAALRQLSCPLVADLDVARFADLALQPTEWRQQLLLWLLTKLDASLALPAKAPQSALLDLLSSLGLCPADRLDLISGSARSRDQLAFLRRFIICAIPPTVPYDRLITSAACLMHGPLSQVPLARALAQPASYLPAGVGAQLRGAVEQRKAASGSEEPLAWRLAAWGGDEAERGRRLAATVAAAGGEEEFVEGRAVDERTQAVNRLSESMQKFHAAHRRGFKAALEQRRVVEDSADLCAETRRGRDAERQEFADSLRRCGAGVAAVQRQATAAEALQAEMQRLRATDDATVEQHVGCELAEEVRAAARTVRDE